MSDLRQLQASPAAFRQALLIDADGEPSRLGDCLDPWQADDFNALDLGWQRVVSGKGEGRRRAWLERPRGHSKTSDLAVMACWALFASRRPVRGIAAAADRDQSKILRDQIASVVRLNPWLARILDVQAYRVVNRHTESDLEIISSDAPSSYGTLADFIIADEVCHWADRGEELWNSLLSTAAKRAACMLLVITNAGFADSWQQRVREAVRTDTAWHFSRLDGPQASWITPDRLAEQRRLLPAIAYRRLWLNEWSSGSGDALSPDDIERAVTLDGPLPESEPGWTYVAGVDLGLSRDASAIAVVARHVGHAEERTKRTPLNPTARAMIELGLAEPPEDEHETTYHPASGRLKLADVKIWQPKDGRRVSVEGVERALLRLHERYGLAAVGCDPWQAAMLIERLQRQGMPIEPCDFSPSNLKSMCSAVLEAFAEGNLDLYEHPRLLADLLALRVEERSYGVRLVSPRGPTGHGDAATALSIALHLARNERVAQRALVPYSLITYP